MMRFSRYVCYAMMALALLGHAQSWLPGLQQWAYDSLVRATANGQLPAHDVAIIRIDDKSLNELGRWPWPREVQARLLTALHQRYQVALIGLDIVMAEAETNPLQAQWPMLCRDLGGVRSAACQQWQQRMLAQLQPDRLFSDQVSGLPVVGGMYFRPEQETAGFLPPAIYPEFPAALSLFQQGRGYVGNWSGLVAALPDSGFLNPAVDADGVIRRVPLLIRHGDALYPSFAARLAARYSDPANPVVEPVFLSDSAAKVVLDAVRMGGRLVREVDAQGRVLLPQYGGIGTIAGYSAADILAGRVPQEALRGKVVIVGATTPALLDIRATPVSPLYPGVEAQASLVQGLLAGMLPWSPPWLNLLVLLGMLVLGMGLIRVFARASFMVCNLWAGAALLLCTVPVWVLWVQYRWVYPVVWPLIMVLGLYLWMVLASRLKAYRQHRQLRAHFSEYIPPEVVDKLDGEAMQNGMKPESRYLTVLFADVRDFSAISELLSPDDLAEMLNIYLSRMTEAIHATQGVVDKYIGDAIMAFWGAPLLDEKQSEHAIATVLAMQQGLEEVNCQFAERGWPVLSIGIALHAGMMRVGNMGSRYRRAYTVMGDAVNVAARAESLTRSYALPMLVTDEVVQSLPEMRWLEVDHVRVKGRQQALTLYTYLSEPADWHDEWIIMRKACRSGDVHTAMQALETARTQGLPDGLYRIYQSRLPNWPADGVWSWQHK